MDFSQCGRYARISAAVRLPSGKGRFQLGQFMPKALFLAMEAMSTDLIVSIGFAEHAEEPNEWIVCRKKLYGY
jgi:hypothetical protein